MSADRSQHPIVHFVGSIPLPDAETVFRTLSGAVGRHVVRLPDGETGIRKTWIRFLQDVLAENPAIEHAKRRAAVQVHPVGRQGDPRDPAASHQARRHARPGAFKTGYADMAIESWGVFERLQKAGAIPAQRQVPDLHPDADRADLQQHGAVRPAEAAAGAHAALHRRGRQDRQGAAERPHRRAVGRLPGGAGLGRLLRARAGRFPHRDHRRPDARSATRCRRRSSSAITCATAARPTSTWCSRRTPASWSR